MKPALLNIAVWPPVEYMAVVLFHGAIILERHEHFQKQSYRNRYVISGPNGLQPLTVPVDKKGMRHILIDQCGITYHENWQQLHWRSIATAYNNSPYYLFFKDELSYLYHQPIPSLWDFAIKTIATASKLLRQESGFSVTKEYKPVRDDVIDLRAQIHPKKGIKGSNASLIAQTNPYPQVFSDRYGFIENLSILDLIFNEGPAGLQWLKKLYEKIIVTSPFFHQDIQP